MSYVRDLAREKQCSSKEMSGSLLLKIVLHRYGKVISDCSLFLKSILEKKMLALGEKNEEKFSLF